MEISNLKSQYENIDWSFVYPNSAYVKLSMKDFKVLKALAESVINPPTQWAVMIGIAPKFQSYEPLAYGAPDDPEPGMLLRRHRIEPFDSWEEAESALKETLAVGKKYNAPWVNWRFKIVEISRQKRIPTESEAAQ